MTVYGFSTENWKRPEEEVSLLMGLIKEYLLSNVKRMHAEGVRIRFVGDITKLSEELQGIIKESEELTQDNKGITLQLAINYGGRDELTRATKQIVQDVAKGVINEEDITETLISSYLDTKEFDRVDLLIRMMHELVISCYGKLLMQSSGLPLYIGQILRHKCWKKPSWHTNNVSVDLVV